MKLLPTMPIISFRMCFRCEIVLCSTDSTKSYATRKSKILDWKLGEGIATCHSGVTVSPSSVLPMRQRLTQRPRLLLLPMRTILQLELVLSMFILTKSYSFLPGMKFRPLSSRPALQVASASSTATTTVDTATFVRCISCNCCYLIDPSITSRRVRCSMCHHTWFQSADRIMTLRKGQQLAPLRDMDRERVALNLKEGKEAKYLGEAVLYLCNLPYDVTEDDLMELLLNAVSSLQLGEVKLARDELGKSRGFGFATARTFEQGQEIIAALDGTGWRGREISVRESTN